MRYLTWPPLIVNWMPVWDAYKPKVKSGLEGMLLSSKMLPVMVTRLPELVSSM